MPIHARPWRRGLALGLATASLAVAWPLAGRAAKARPSRELGRIQAFRERLVVPVGGLSLHAVAAPSSCYRRTLVVVSASAPPHANRPAVRLALAGSQVRPEHSGNGCFEALSEQPPFKTCTSEAGTGWDGCAGHEMTISVENRVGQPVTVELAIAVIDPAE